MARRLILAVVMAALGVLAGPMAGASAAPSLSISDARTGRRHQRNEAADLGSFE